MRVIFMGTPEYASEILKALVADEAIDVVAVYTQPDKPVGRKKVLTPPPVKETALASDLTLYQPQRLRDDATIREVLEIECDFIVVAAFGQILPKEILDHAPCINLHASILPFYRGASPIQQTLLNGESITGVTAMLMEEGLDTGAILAIKQCDVESDLMADALFERLTHLAKALTLEVLHNFETYTPVEQLSSEATYCKKISKSDGLVSFAEARVLYNRYRAFTPWPGVFLESGLKLKSIAFEDERVHANAGEILVIDKDSILVACLKGTLRIFTVQPESKNEMSVISYINGKRLGIADILL